MHICMVVFTELVSDFRVFRTASALADAGHRISIVAGSGDGGELHDSWSRFEVHSIPVDRRASLRFAYPRFWHRSWSVLCDLGADVYHAHDLDTLWPAAKAANRCGAALVYDSHELWTEQSAVAGRAAIRFFWRRLEARLITRADAVIAVSDSIARALEEDYRLTRPITVVRNLPPYRTPVSGHHIHQALDLDPACPVALYQGGFLTDNGLSEQIDSMRFIEGEGVLVLLGGGPTEVQLRRQVAEGGFEQRVRFLPRVPFQELHEFTCSADVGLCLIKPSGASFAMSLPNKLFEYFMAGLPVLGSSVPEIRRIVEETAGGEVVDVTDPRTIAAALSKLLGDPSLRHSYGEAALAAARRYNWEREAPALCDLYRVL